MSNSTDTTGCISHKPNCRYFIIYEDFRDIARKASGTEHEYKLAAFWRVLETKTNDRITAIPEIAEECKQKGIPIPEKHLWIEMSYADFAKRAQGVYKSSSFQVAAAESERLGFSKSRNLKRPRNPSDPESALEDYKEYLFSTDVMQTAITKGELPPPIEINSPLLKSIPERKKKRQEKRAIDFNRDSLLKSIAPPIEINTSPLLNSIGNNNIDKNITNNITNNEREIPPNIPDTHTIVSSDTAHAALPSKDEIPVTFADCLSYLQEQGVAPRGEDAVEVMVQARTLYAHKHPRYSSRALPGLETHPDDQLPSQQNEQLFTNEPQGDDHEPIIDTASHHLHSPSRGLGTARSPRHPHSTEALQTSDERNTTPDRRDVPLEGEHHATVPALPAANPAVPGQRPASRHLPSDSAVSPGDRHGCDVDIPVVRDATDGERQASRAATRSVDGEDPAETLAETPPTSTPAQSLSLPQAEQAASGAKQEPKPLSEPEMSGKWSHEKCVEYAEWCNQRRYTDKMHEEQLKAAASIHKNDAALTLEQFKQAYDERNDAWWQEHKKKLHVTDMKAKGASGIDRVHEMLQRIEDAASRSRTQPRLQVVASRGAIKRYSSYDDPNFSSEQDFYPVEGGSYAAASI